MEENALKSVEIVKSKKKRLPIISLIMISIAFISIVPNFLQYVLLIPGVWIIWSVLEIVAYVLFMVGLILKQNRPILCGISFLLFAFLSTISLILNMDSDFISCIGHFTSLVACTFIGIAYFVNKPGFSKTFRIIGGVFLLVSGLWLSLIMKGQLQIISNGVVDLIFVSLPKTLAVLFYNPLKK